MATGRELEQVQGEHAAGFYAGNVPEGTHELFAIFVRVVDDQGPATLAVTTASELAFARAKFAACAHFCNIGTGADGLEEGKRCGGLCDLGVCKGIGGYDEGNLGDGGDVVAAG